MCFYICIFTYISMYSHSWFIPRGAKRNGAATDPGESSFSLLDLPSSRDHVQTHRAIHSGHGLKMIVSDML